MALVCLRSSIFNLSYLTNFISSMFHEYHLLGLFNFKQHDILSSWLNECCRLHDAASVPDLPGLASFPGSVIHSSQYRFPEVYDGKIVLMIGGWVSMIDICQLVAKHAEKVHS